MNGVLKKSNQMIQGLANDKFENNALSYNFEKGDSDVDIE